MIKFAIIGWIYLHFFVTLLFMLLSNDEYSKLLIISVILVVPLFLGRLINKIIGYKLKDTPTVGILLVLFYIVDMYITIANFNHILIYDIFLVIITSIIPIVILTFI